MKFKFMQFILVAPNQLHSYTKRTGILCANDFVWCRQMLATRIHMVNVRDARDFSGTLRLACQPRAFLYRKQRRQQIKTRKLILTEFLVMKTAFLSVLVWTFDGERGKKTRIQMTRDFFSVHQTRVVGPMRAQTNKCIHDVQLCT